MSEALRGRCELWSWRRNSKRWNYGGRGNAIDPLGWRFYDFGMEKPAKWMLLGLVVVVVGSILVCRWVNHRHPRQYLYSSNGNAITILGYGGSGGTVTIPEKINGLPVTSIGDWAGTVECLPKSRLRSMLLNITGGTFHYCTNLTSVVIPNSVTSIGKYAFFLCKSITSITIPVAVTNIGLNAFLYCPRLTAIMLDTNHPSYSSLDGVLFNKSQTTLIQFPGGKVGNYTIPSSVTNIGVGAFSGCRSLTNITISDSVSSIGGSAFSGCTNLTSITLPDSVKNIQNYAFFCCDSLTNITLPNSVTNIGQGMFYQCTKLTGITLPNSVVSIGGRAFNQCTSLTSITIPNNVTKIGGEAFIGCSSLTSVVIPNSVTEIAGWAFSGCSRLKSVTIPDGITKIEKAAFGGCSSLTSVTIPNSVTHINFSAFYGCTGLKGVFFNGNAPTGRYLDVFGGCPNATVYYLPETKYWHNTFGGRPTAVWKQ